MQTPQDPVNIDDLATLTIRLGREFVETARDLHLGGNSADVALIARCTARLVERDPFSNGVEGGLVAIQGMLERDIKAEVLGVEERYVETHFDETGQHGEIREVPVHTDRGEDLVSLQRLFDHFCEKRNSVLDHIAAHRILIARMSG